jgi:hypothetical protein
MVLTIYDIISHIACIDIERAIGLKLVIIQWNSHLGEREGMDGTQQVSGYNNEFSHA